MADISGLNLRTLDETNWDDYPVGGNAPKPNYPGLYFGRLKDIVEFKSSNGYLTIVVDIEIIDAEEGTVRSVRDWLFTKPIQTGSRKGSCRAGDFLIACGSKDKPGADPQEWADAVEAQLGSEFSFYLDWSCYNSATGEELARTYDNFPPDPNDPALRQPFFEVQDAEGNNKRLTARQKVRYYKTR